MGGATLAAIDCGTNSTRLLVVGPDGTARSRLMRITRLGQGVDATRRLDAAAIRRTLAVLGEFRTEMDRLGVERVRMVATSAVRDASNGSEFLDDAGRLVGTPAELLSGLEEGRLAYAGATADLGPAPGDDLVVDIGGGSTELIVGRGEVTGVISLDIGCVRLTERHFHEDPPSPDEVAEAVVTIDEELDRAKAEVAALQHLGPDVRLIGLAGSVSTLSMLEQGLADYDRDRVHHAVLTAEAVGRWCEVLAVESSAERARRPGMVAGREDVIFGGALVLRQTMRRFDADRCLVSESDILDGLVASLAGV